MSQESTDEQQIRELAAAVGHAAAALQIPRHGLGARPAPGADPGPGSAGADPSNDDDIDGALDPDDELAGNFVAMDLLAETMQLYRRTKRLMEHTLRSKTTPSNQKAQTVNALANLLKGLAAQQTELYNAERLKRLENLVITAVKDLAPDTQDEFIRRYEAEVNVR